MHSPLLPIRRFLREFRVAIEAVLCPACCPGCGAASPGLCAPCRVLLVRRPPPLCARCGEPVPAGARCTADHSPWVGLRWVRAPFRYRGTAGAIVRRLKFRRDPEALAYLSRALAEAARDLPGEALRRARILSVPLHPEKLRRRGFDQAQALAQGLAERLRAEWVPGALVRLRATLPQADPRVTSRSDNVAGAFAVARPKALSGRMVLLVDDVTTSGATARECARVLHAAGVAAVALLTAARS